MIGIVVLILLLCIEVGFAGMRIVGKKQLGRVKAIVNIGTFLVFLLLMVPQIISFSLRWGLLIVLLGVRTVLSVIILVRKKDRRKYKLSRTISTCFGSVLLIGAGMIPALLFPQYEEIPVTGSFQVNTVTYTWEDQSRVETFIADGSKRKVTVQFWYPNTQNTDKFPLVVFSHGAFGFRYSNYSTYQELASNGYVVCSIDHPYHAFYTKQTDGKVITVNPEFMNNVAKVNQNDTSEDDIFSITRGWMELRLGDMNFVIDNIEKLAREQESGQLFSLIDTTKIGVMGHSLGGATAVTAGRQRSDIDAVIDLDGTMLGEELACSNNRYTINEEPYPIPLLCIDTTGHYEEGLTYGDQYVNNVILKKAVDGREVHFNKAEHMNFTDLPVFSPTLASVLGTGNIDSLSCIKTMNTVILNYYNYYLKQSGELTIKDTY